MRLTVEKTSLHLFIPLGIHCVHPGGKGQSGGASHEFPTSYTTHRGGLVLKQCDKASIGSVVIGDSWDTPTQLQCRQVPILNDFGGTSRDIVWIIGNCE